jgi:plastocyanin
MRKPVVRLGLVIAALALAGASCYKKTTNANYTAANANADTGAASNASVTNTNPTPTSGANTVNTRTQVTTDAANVTVTTNTSATANGGNANASVQVQTESTSSTTVNATIKNYAFSASNLTVTKGTKVVWTNEDSVGHSVTSDSGSELASATLSTGESYSHTFTKTGTFPYHCAPHSYMTGTVTVTE